VVRFGYQVPKTVIGIKSGVANAVDRRFGGAEQVAPHVIGIAGDITEWIGNASHLFGEGVVG